MMVQIAQLLAVLALGLVAGGLTIWFLIDGDDARTAELLAREEALRARIDELNKILQVPPLFWEVWEHYTHEHGQRLLEEFTATGTHAQHPDEPASDLQQPDDEQQ